MLTGTIINSLTILAGSAVGLVLRAVTRRSSKEVSADGLGGRLQTIIMQGMALCVLYIGVSGCLKGQNTFTAPLCPRWNCWGTPAESCWIWTAGCGPWGIGSRPGPPG